MQRSAGSTEAGKKATDIFFKCDHCDIPLVVNEAGAGLTLKCQRCGKPTTVPSSSRPAISSAKLVELQRHLKENESQRTEINGYINQLSIQLHRWQLRLQTLNERNKQLADEMAGLDRADRPQAAS